MANTNTMPDYPRGITFEQVWAAIQASDERLDRLFAESARQIAENARQMQESRKRFDDFSNRFGEILEHMVMPNLVDKFEKLGFTFTKANRTEVKDKEHDLFFEVDALLENGDKVMAVEVKSKPELKHGLYVIEPSGETFNITVPEGKYHPHEW